MSRRTESALWLGAGATIVVLVVGGFLASPLIAFGVFVLIAAVVVSVALGRGVLRGVGVAGALVWLVALPPLHTPVPGWLGLAVATAWLLVFALLGIFEHPAEQHAPRRDWWTFGLFALLVGLGMLSTAFIRPLPFVGFVLLFLAGWGFYARGLTVAEWAVVRRTVVGLGFFTAAVCLVEFSVFRGDPLDDSSGFHPVLAAFTRPEATLGHPIVAGVAILAGLVLLLGSSVSRPRKIVGSVVLLAGIFTTGSSSVYIAALIGVLLQTVLSGGAVWRTLKAAAVLAVGVYLVAHESLITPLVNDVSGNNSTHRLNSVRAIPDLVTKRPLFDALFGTGWGSEAENYRSGFLKNDYFYSVDNMFTTVMMAAGLVGFALFCIILIRVFVVADGPGKLAVVTLSVMLFSFDVLQWASVGALMLAILLNTRVSRVHGRYPAGIGRVSDEVSAAGR